MKKIKEIVILTILFFACNTYAQTTTTKTKEKLKADAEKANIDRKAKQNIKKESVPAGSVNTQPVVQLNENDPYQGRKQEFENLFLDKKLPSDFPLYHASYGVKGYNQMIDSYCIGHLNLLNEQVKQKITGHP